MVSMAERIEELRGKKNLSCPALAAALGFPKTAVEKFETGRQTPSQEQQEKLAAFFGVSVSYLRGGTADGTCMGDWMDGAFLDGEPAPVPRRIARPAKPVASSSGAEQGTLFDSFLTSKKFQETLHAAVLDTLRSPEGKKLLAQAVQKEMGRR